MKSISENQSRHRIIARKEERYISFPDICELGSGRILIAYRNADKHVASESRLICEISEDKGETWLERVLPNPEGGHCPRITYFSDGRLCIYDDGSQGIYWSKDEGETWEKSPLKNMYENQFLHFGIADRVFELEGSLFSAIHINMGMRKVEINESGYTIDTVKYPTTGQVIKSSLMIRSDDLGKSWYPYSLIACERDIVLCETSICKLQDGTLLAIHRENTSSTTYEPMYKTISTDNGVSWSRPEPIPIIGQRPTVGITKSGKILITYRNVGPKSGTCVWMGDMKELDGFKVHGTKHGKDNPVIENNILKIKNTKQVNSEVYYALRPISDLLSAYAELEVEVMAKGSEKGVFGIHFGVWWYIQPDSIQPDAKDEKAIKLEKDEWQIIKFIYDRGRCSVEINMQKKLSIDVPINVDSRPIIIGNIHKEYNTKNEGAFMVRKISHSINEPYYNRQYKWNWTPNEGFPDKYIDNHFLELKNADKIEYCDFGYSGWAELSEGNFLCAYYHYEGDDYIPQKSAYIMGTYFSEKDFS